jgi:hypothetical protein
MIRTAARAVAVIGLLLVASCGSGPGYSAELTDFESVEAERVSLGDGGELAIGSDREERFVAQWGEPDGSGWTKPQTVVRDPGLEASEVTLARGGPVAVAGFSWYAVDDDEQENFERQDAAVCHGRTCDVIEDVHGTPMVDGDGTFVAVGAEEDSLTMKVWQPSAGVWDAPPGAGGSWGTLTVSGPPAGAEGFDAPHQVRLLDDATFATVVGVLVDGACSFELWQSVPRAGELSKVAATEPRAQSTCNPENLQSRGTKVSFYNRNVDQEITFRRDGSGWTDDQAEDGPLPIDERSGIPMILTQLRGDGGSVAVGSPDTRRIVAQHRAPGEDSWSGPVTVATASEGQECRVAVPATTLDTADVMYLVQCWPEGSAWGGRHDDAPPPTSGFAVASADGRSWVSEPLNRPAYGPELQTPELLLLARGAERSLVWRPGAKGFDELKLPLDNPTVDAVAITGDIAIRVTGNPDESKPCRPTWSVAPLTADAWGKKHGMGPTPEWVGDTTDCYAVAGDVATTRDANPGREFSVGAVVGNNGRIGGLLRRTGDGWRFEADD